MNYYCTVASFFVIILNSKIAFITIEFIVGSFEKFGIALKTDVKKKEYSNGCRLALLKNQRENNLESKNAAFYSFLRRRNFHLKKKIFYVNNFDRMIVKLRMYTT